MLQRELINIGEFQRRVWGENGTPLTAQAISSSVATCPGSRWESYGLWTGRRTSARLATNWSMRY